MTSPSGLKEAACRIRLKAPPQPIAPATTARRAPSSHARLRFGSERKTWMWLISTAYRNSRRGSSPRALTPLLSSELVLARAPPLGLDLATRSVVKTEGRKKRDAVGPNRL
jgi:hypothetical protein